LNSEGNLRPPYTGSQRTRFRASRRPGS
jgi:hypothetical protein